MAFLRTLMLALAIALGTIWLAWWVVPVVGLGYGAFMHRSRRPGLTAAAAGSLAWGGYLALLGAGGGPVSSFATSLAESMQVPGYAPLLATLGFPAILAGTASYLGARAADRYLSRP